MFSAGHLLTSWAWKPASRSIAGKGERTAAGVRMQTGVSQSALPAQPAGRLLTLAIATALIAASGAPGEAFAVGGWPGKPIRLVIPFAPGGSNDVLARLLAPRAGEALGQPLVIDNRAGAGGTLASELVARAAPDGYTLILVASTHAFALAMQGRNSFDPVRDFTAITLIGTSPLALVVHPQVAAKDAPEFVALARREAGRIAIGSGGMGSIGHLSIELLQLVGGVKVTHVPYKGGGPVLADLVAGHVQASFLSLAAAAPQIRAGRLRALAITGAQRAPGFEPLPTFTEQGYKIRIEQWWGVLGPAGLAPAITARVHAEFTRARSAAEARERLAELGVITADLAPDGFRRFLEREVADMVQLVKTAGIRAE